MTDKITVRDNVIYRNNLPIYIGSGNINLFDIRNKKDEILGYIAKTKVGLNGHKYIVITDNSLYQRESLKIAIDLIDGVLKKDYKEIMDRIIG